MICEMWMWYLWHKPFEAALRLFFYYWARCVIVNVWWWCTLPFHLLFTRTLNPFHFVTLPAEILYNYLLLVEPKVQTLLDFSSSAFLWRHFEKKLFLASWIFFLFRLCRRIPTLLWPCLFMTTWVESSYTIYKSLCFNPLKPLYLSPVIKQLALNKNCAVVLVWFVCLISIFSVCLFDYKCCLSLTQGYEMRTKSFKFT